MTNEIQTVPPSETKKWIVALTIALVLTVISVFYGDLAFPHVEILVAWSMIIASVSSFMLAISLSASSFSYFIGFPNMKDGYQKQIGIVAFWLAFIYCLFLLVLYPETYGYGLADNFFTADVFLGLLAMTILGAMVFINAKPFSQYFSWDTIKFVLGLGFVGYALLVIRAILIEWPLWADWLTTFEGYPPGRLVLSLIAFMVLCLRVCVSIHQARHPREVKK
ncbi:MAG TPA: hypothetical protein PKA42_00975 [Candidatus Paceibacterota bacterium]|nr:hypothetical protein [Candidatus Paceibacterota bacterium]HMO82716.1 hypothetical protein [Candidatus Paceibacterota bacterium]